MDITIDDIDGGQRPVALPDEHLRLLNLTADDVWPKRDVCELALVVECRGLGFAMTDIFGTLCVGEIALLPLGDGLISSGQGRVLSAQMEAIPAPSEPQRLSESPIAQRLRRLGATLAVARREAN